MTLTKPQLEEKAKLEEKIANYKHVDKTFRGLAVTLALLVFPALSTIYPTAWVLAPAYITLTGFAILLILGGIGAFVAIYALDKLPSELQQLHGKLNHIRAEHESFALGIILFWAFILALEILGFSWFAAILGIAWVFVAIATRMFIVKCRSYT